MTNTSFKLLNQIDTPDDLRRLSRDELPQLATEIRLYLLETLNQCGGHFGASLGATELTIALHYVFNTPDDKLVWDVGHQTYVHKILTGRREQLSTIRQTDGLAPFLQPSESPYDAFGAGHSSTSIGIALGMAAAARQLGSPNKAVAIIGDGGMTAGMAFEALNHAGDTHADLIVVLNDNEMSISPNVGALSNRFAQLMSGHVLSGLREGGKRILKNTPMWNIAKRAETQLKGMMTPGAIFEELGFKYFGPVDGHDLPGLIKTLENLKEQRGPVLLHAMTVKGKGYEPAEDDPVGYHAVKAGFLTPDTTAATSKPNKQPTYSNVFGQWLYDMAAQDDKLIAVTPAMCEGSDLVRFAKQYPERYFDVGIAEQHAVTFAAGAAANGLKPVVAIYSTFLQRAYDQLIHDVAIENLPVLFAIDRAGIVGGDGRTHQGAFDLSYLRCVPNMVIMAPSDENECRQMLYTGFVHHGPAAVRYPRGTGPNTIIQDDMTALPIGKAKVERCGKDIAILAFGSMLAPAITVGEQLDATVVNMRFVKPLDVELVCKLANSHQHVITIEENVIAGGAGSAVNETLQQHHINTPVLNLGLPDEFIEHGASSDILARCSLDETGIHQQIKHWLQPAQQQATAVSV